MTVANANTMCEYMKKIEKISSVVALAYFFCVAFFFVICSEAVICVLMTSSFNWKAIIVAVLLWLSSGIALKAIKYTIDKMVEDASNDED